MIKIIFDPIHGYIRLCQKSIRIISTSEFQRLRDIKQVGPCYHVFPGASHNRFEHSLGVAHLSRLTITNIRNNQPELNITNKDIEDVEIAGLCHDLGHGPFSHLFDDHIVKDSNSPNRHHEERSCMILDYISKTYNIDIDLDRIRLMIIPPKKSTDNIDDINNIDNKEKNYLFRIVSNPESGIDVDKFDYIVRDTYNIGLKFGFDCSRLVNECRIIDGELCFPSKEIYNIYEMYHTRYRLHKQVYHHHAVHSIEHMYADLLKELDSTLKISKMIDYPVEFCKLTDNYIINIVRNDIEDNTITNMTNIIDNTQNPIVNTHFPKAKMILERINRRDLYKFVGEFVISPDKDLNLLDKFEADLKTKNTNIFISRSIIGFNKEGFNPVDEIYFYKTGNENIKLKIDRTKVSCLLPDRYNELIIRFFCKSKEYFSVTKHYFELFKKVLTKS